MLLPCHWSGESRLLEYSESENQNKQVDVSIASICYDVRMSRSDVICLRRMLNLCRQQSVHSMGSLLCLLVKFCNGCASNYV